MPVNPVCRSAPFLNIWICSHISVSRLEYNEKGHNFILYLPLHLLLNTEGREETAYQGARRCWWQPCNAGLFVRASWEDEEEREAELGIRALQPWLVGAGEGGTGGGGGRETVGVGPARPSSRTVPSWRAELPCQVGSLQLGQTSVWFLKMRKVKIEFKCLELPSGLCFVKRTGRFVQLLSARAAFPYLKRFSRHRPDKR